MGINRYIAAMLFTGSGCFAQTDSLSNPYIQKFEDKISTQLFILNTSNQFTLDYSQENLTVDLVPNQKTTLGVSVQYDFISFSFGIAPKFFAENKDNKGSKMTAYSMTLFPGRWMQHFDLIYQKGISLEAPQASIYYSGLKTFKVGGSTSYVFNKNYSFRALAFQSERQLKSAGSFAPQLSYYYTELNGNKTEDLKGKSYFIDVALSPAYNYNWVIAKKFLVGAGFSLGGGITYMNDEGDDETHFLSTASLSISLGYNSDTFYGGLYTKGTASNHSTESKVEMNDAVSFGTIFFGYRFNAPDVLTREKNKIKTKYNL
ncbi:DUF4421 family protein [Flavobacterium suzhouense]|uniref:DUF4421 family protein n=1 Tax=Flavobacterium suzhouense TaxID=1529638 RepID=A0ABW5NU31_9FLAO